MNRAVTRNDVAKLANVSPAIVSYVLNNSNYVSEEKREAVLQAISALNYIPNQLARGLKTNRSSQFAFVCDNIQTELFETVEESLFEKGYYLSLNYSRDTEGFLEMLVSRQLDGIFMATNMFSSSQLNYIADKNIPIILYKTKEYKDLDPRVKAVAPNYYDAVKKSVNYLALKGHTCIGMIPPLKYRTKGLEGDDYRARAFKKSLELHNLAVSEDLICTKTKTVADIYESVFSMLSNPNPKLRPTSLVVGNDYLAAQIIQYLKKLNISVPRDLAVVGCDNTRIAELTTPALTSVDVSKERLAEAYVSKMLDLVNGKEVEGEYTDVHLIIRESA